MSVISKEVFKSRKKNFEMEIDDKHGNSQRKTSFFNCLPADGLRKPTVKEGEPL